MLGTVRNRLFQPLTSKKDTKIDLGQKRIMPMFVSGPKKQKPAGVKHPSTHARTHTHAHTHLQPLKDKTWTKRARNLKFWGQSTLHLFFLRKINFSYIGNYFAYVSTFLLKNAKIGHFASKYDKKAIKKHLWNEEAIFSKVPVTLLKMALLYKYCF